MAQVRSNRLVDDYLNGVPRAAAFYEGNPRDPAAWTAKLAEVRARFGRAERERAAAALTPTSARAAERLRRFVDEGGAMVTTGQQAGLFTGPLYTVHKILSAIRLAEALERELGVIVLPVFWAASEDHDFAEVNHAWAVSAEGELRRLSVAATSPTAVPMSEMRLGPDVDATVDELAQLMAGQGDAGPWMTLLRDAYSPDVTVADAFRAAVAALFADFDLLVTDAADPALKAASVGVLLAELAHAAEHERLVAEQTAALQAAGYTTQVTLVEGATNVFWHGPAGRERLHRDDGGFVAAEARRRFSFDELRRLLEADPRALSPNVFLRRWWNPPSSPRSRTWAARRRRRTSRRCAPSSPRWGSARRSSSRASAPPSSPTRSRRRASGWGSTPTSCASPSTSCGSASPAATCPRSCGRGCARCARR